MTSKQMHHELELGLIVVIALIDNWLILVHCRARLSLLCPHPCLYFLVCSARPSEDIHPCFSGLQQLSTSGSSPSNCRQMLLPSWIEEGVMGRHWKALSGLWWNISVPQHWKSWTFPVSGQCPVSEAGCQGLQRKKHEITSDHCGNTLSNRNGSFAPIYLEHKHASHWGTSTFPELTEVLFIL